MPRKVFLSVLGTGFYQPCQYEDDVAETRFIQVATLRRVTRQTAWTAGDHGYVFVTDKARSDNWGVTERKRPNSDEIVPYEGLESGIEKLNLPFAVEPVAIPDGHNEQEIWQIFEAMYGVMQEGDELYIDLTHSFRFIPMLLLVLLQYARLLKHVKVQSVTYGNFEGRDKERNVAPVIDLLPLVELQEWTDAVSSFVNKGDVRKLNVLHEPNLKARLRETQGGDTDAHALSQFSKFLQTVMNQMLTCQGRDLTNAKEILKAKELLTQVKNSENMLPQFRPLVEQFDLVLQGFNGEPDVRNVFCAAKLCLRFGLYQQCLTILQEGVVSLLAEQNGLQWGVIGDRESVSSALHIVFQTIPREEWTVKEENVKMVEHLVETECIRSISRIYSVLSQLRNQFNHAGMLRTRQFNEKIMREKIEKVMADVETWLSGQQTRCPNADMQLHLFLNLSNHPSAGWSREQAAAAAAFGEIRDIPFPDVRPDANAETLDKMAEDLCKEIGELAKGTDVTLHIMGEMGLTYRVVSRMKTQGIRCVASTTERCVVNNPDGTKTVSFQFVKFREY